MHDDPLDDMAHPRPDPICDDPKPEPKSPFEEELLKDRKEDEIKRIMEVPPVNLPVEKYERGFRTKKTSLGLVNVNIYEEARIGHLLLTDTTEVLDAKFYPKDFVYMISNQGDFSSEERKKRFPFHVKTYLINQN